MRVRPLGEDAALVDDLNAESVGELARFLNERLDCGVREVVPAYEVLGVYGTFNPEWRAWLERGIAEHAGSPREAKHHRIPICYSMGLDLESTAEFFGISDTELIRLHCSVSYECYAVGFAPGFAYLGHLPPQIDNAPRHAEPRVRVPKGSLGIAGRQTAVYPSETPGGWQLIGRCPLELVCVNDDYFPISVGDTVEFVPITPQEFMALEGRRL